MVTRIQITLLINSLYQNRYTKCGYKICFQVSRRQIHCKYDILKGEPILCRENELSRLFTDYGHEVNRERFYRLKMKLRFDGTRLHPINLSILNICSQIKLIFMWYFSWKRYANSSTHFLFLKITF